MIASQIIEINSSLSSENLEEYSADNLHQTIISTINATHQFRSETNLKVRVERTGWRDEWISNRHREFGWNAAFTDIDFMGLEYDQGKPVCLIEYKHQNAKITLSHPSVQAQKWLADKAELPFYLVVYYPDEFAYYVVPVNEFAQKVVHCDQSKFWSERNFVKLLYFLRGRNCPTEILEKMSSKLDKNLPLPNFLT